MKQTLAKPRQNRIVVAVTIIVLLGLVLRLINLGSRNLWYDEAFAVLYAEKSFSAILYGTITQVEGAAAEEHPLLYYFFLHLWMSLFGQSPFIVRLPSVIFGLASIVLAFSIGQRLFDPDAGLLATAITAIAPFHINYSQENRMYSLLCFLSLLTVYFFVRCWARAAKPGEPEGYPLNLTSFPSRNRTGGPTPRTGKRESERRGDTPHAPRPAARAHCWKGSGYGNWLGFILAATLSLYTHNLAFLVILALDLFVLATILSWIKGKKRGTPPLSRPDGAVRLWRLLKLLIVSHLALGLLFSPWLTVVFSQFGKIRRAYWVPRPGLKELVQTLIFFHFDLLPTMPLGLVSTLLFISLLILVLTLYRVVRVRGRDRQTKEGIFLLLILALAPVIVTFLISQFKSIYIIRGLLPAAAAYYILMAKILAEAQLPTRLPKRAAWLLLSPVVVLLTISLTYHYTYAQFPRAPFDKAVTYLRENYQLGDAIVHDNKLTFFPCHYYDRELPQTFIADEPGSPADTLAYPTQQALGLFATPDIGTATQGHERVWFVIFRRALDEYHAAGYSDHPHRAWLEQHYTLVSVTSFNDLEVYEYESGLSPTAFLGLEGSR